MHGGTKLVPPQQVYSSQAFPKNIGFGQAHNWAISEAKKKGSKYHFVVNPDIFYSKDAVLPMVEFMEHNQEVGEMMPKILYPNGRTQFLPKLMPSPLMLAQRKLSQFSPLYAVGG